MCNLLPKLNRVLHGSDARDRNLRSCLTLRERLVGLFRLKSFLKSEINKFSLSLVLYSLSRLAAATRARNALTSYRGWRVIVLSRFLSEPLLSKTSRKLRSSGASRRCSVRRCIGSMVSSWVQLTRRAARERSSGGGGGGGYTMHRGDLTVRELRLVPSLRRDGLKPSAFYVLLFKMTGLGT